MKPHLLLVHSFPTNSILLNGLEQFLSDFFTVHFVNLPGCHKDNPPFDGELTLERFSDYFDKKVAELDVDEYVAGGVSFGFLVANRAKLDKRCKAVLAIEPFVNTACLNISPLSQKCYVYITRFFKFLQYLHMEERVWKSSWFRRILQIESGHPRETADTIIQHFDFRTFFFVTEPLFSYYKDLDFHEIPYFLIGNFEDKVINFNSVTDVFKKGRQNLHIASVPIDHYPKELTKEYFQSKIPREDIYRIVEQIRNLFTDTTAPEAKV